MRGDLVQDRYWGEDNGPYSEDGWAHMGDLGFVDEAGFLHVVGRVKDIIIRGGSNINPYEVESMLRAHPDVWIPPEKELMFFDRDDRASDCIATPLFFHGGLESVLKFSEVVRWFFCLGPSLVRPSQPAAGMFRSSRRAGCQPQPVSLRAS